MNALNESVLVVEDDAALREALTDTLRAAGIMTLAAGDAGAALDLLESEEIALIISDVQMPGPNGYELLAAIKRRRPDLPVVLMTAYGTVLQAVSAMREGATDYIVKPFDAEALIDMARRQLAARVMPNELIAADADSQAHRGARPQDCRQRGDRAPHRRKRHGQGGLRALHPRSFQPRRSALRRHQLRRHPGEHARGHLVRLREGRVHGRARAARRQVRAGAGRNAAAR